MHLITQQHLQQVAEHTNTPTSSRRVAPTQQGSSLPINTLGPTFSTTCRLPATTHCPAQPAHPQQPHTARAPAGRRSPTGSWAFLPLNHRPPPLLHSSRGPRDPTGSAVLTGALRSPSSAAQPCISAREAPPKSAIPPKPARSDSAHAYRLEAEACAPDHYTYAMDTVKDG